MPPKGSKRTQVDAPNEPSLADTLSYLHVPKPFKNSNYIRQGSKRNRTVKQLLSVDREREKAYHEQASVNATQAMQLDQTPATLPPPQVFYSNIEAPPSILPPSTYCDITGLHGPYTHPTTRLRYHDASIYSMIKSLNPSLQQSYLSIRGMTGVM